MNRFLPWFATQNGRYFTYSCVGLTGISIFGTVVACHGPFQHKFKNLIQVYKDGKEKLLSPKLQELTQIVVNDSTIKDSKKSKLKFFNVIGEELFHIGGTNWPWGAMIGLPFYFEDSKNINFKQLQLTEHEPIDWVIDGQDLLAALNISDKAKKFGMMRELYSADVWHILDNACIATTCFLAPAELARRINIKRDAFKTPRIRGRLFGYLVCYLMGFIMYRCFKDPMHHLSEKRADHLAALTGPEYLEGGIEFYEKLLAKNKALRLLLKERGEKKFQADGNENYFLFAPKLPTKKRLEFLQEMKPDVHLVAA